MDETNAIDIKKNTNVKKSAVSDASYRGLHNSDPNIILPTSSHEEALFTSTGGIESLNPQKKVSPVIVRSFRMDVDEAMKREKNVKEAISLQRQMKEAPVAKKDPPVIPAVPKKEESLQPGVKQEVKKISEKDMEVAKFMSFQQKRPIPQAPTPPYKENKIVNVGNGTPIKNVPKSIPPLPAKASESLYKNLEFIAKKVSQESPSEQQPAPLKKEVARKEIIFPRLQPQPKKEVPTPPIVPVQPVVPKIVPEKAPVVQKMAVPLPKVEIPPIAVQEKPVQNEVVKKQPQPLAPISPTPKEDPHAVFDALLKGDHVSSAPSVDVVKTVPEEKKESAVLPQKQSLVVPVIKKETPAVTPPIVPSVIAPVVPVQPVVPKIVPEKPPVVQKIEQKPKLPDVHVGEDELHTLKNEVLQIEAEIKVLGAEKESTVAQKEHSEKEQQKFEAEAIEIKKRLDAKIQQEEEVERNIREIMQREPTANSYDERHAVEQKRWEQEDVRATITKEKWEIADIYEKSISVANQAKQDLSRASESLNELVRQLERRTKERDEKRSKVRLGEIESKKREIEDIQIALLEEKRRLDRLHTTLEGKEKEFLSKRVALEESEKKAEALSEKRGFSEARFGIEKEQRGVEEERWVTEKSLEKIMEKIAKSNEHYATITKLEDEVREKLFR